MEVAQQKKNLRFAAPGSARVQVRYDSHLPVLSIRDGEKVQKLPEGMVLLMFTTLLFAVTGTCGCLVRNSSIKNGMPLTSWRWRPPLLGC